MSSFLRAFLCLVVLFAVSIASVGSALAQTGDSAFVINLRDTEIEVFAEQISSMTGRTLVLDPTVRGEVTVISSEPLDQEEVWALFQSVLRVNGFAAVRSGQVWRIIPQASAPQGGSTIDRTGTPDSQDFVTRLVRLRNLPAAEALRVLQPLVASFGVLEALERPNAIVITDSAENVRRLEGLALALDSGEDTGYGTFRLRYANAAAASNVLIDIIGEELRVSVDERSNTLLVKGRPELISQARELLAGLDRPGEGATSTRVIRLRYADAESVVDVLRGLMGSGGDVSNPVARNLTESSGGLSQGRDDNALRDMVLGTSSQSAAPLPPPTGGSQAAGPSGFSSDGLAVETAPDINAIVARGSPTAVAQIEELVAQLDVRRPQVMIEAAIVEISGDVADQFGIQLGLGAAAVPGGNLAATSFSNTGTSLQNILRLLGVPAAVGLTSDGLSVGVNAGFDFSILVQALSQSSKANLMSTPSLTTLDNQAAEIIVGQDVPFRTGSFTTPGNSVQPFTTITRENVGISMRVLPRINDGDVIRLEVSQEVSSLVAANVPGAADLITNRRSIQTTVLADNGGTIVLGGLITNDQISNHAEVPVLGRIPVVGELFKSRKETNTRRTLFVFLRPTILRNRHDVGIAAEQKHMELQEVAAEPEPHSRLPPPPEPHGQISPPPPPPPLPVGKLRREKSNGIYWR